MKIELNRFQFEYYKRGFEPGEGRKDIITNRKVSNSKCSVLWREKECRGIGYVVIGLSTVEFHGELR